jgi:signal transduction histidine kinase
MKTRLPKIAFHPMAALAVSVGLILASIAMVLYQENLFERQAAQEATVQAEILASSVTAALAFNDKRTAQEYVNALRANPDVQAAAVYANNNKQMARFVRPGAADVPPTVAPHAAILENNRVIVAVSAVERGNSLGTVYLRAATESSERRILRYGVLVLLVTMGALLTIAFAAAQISLRHQNERLAERAAELAQANDRLKEEMEQRTAAEEALRQSQKMEALGHLSGGIAHDFNNLIAIIKGNVQLLIRRLQQGRTDVLRYAEFALDGADRASVLTNRILAFSRQQPLSPIRVNISLLVKGMLDLIRQSVGNGTEIVTELQARQWIICDPNQMEHAILNLANNARDAMPDGGILRISTADIDIEPQKGSDDPPPGRYVSLEIKDNGVGMSKEVKEKALDPFFTTKPTGQGTGLGLSMIFGYVRQSGGYLKIDSEPDVGTAITILFPQVEAEGQGTR